MFHRRRGQPGERISIALTMTTIKLPDGTGPASDLVFHEIENFGTLVFN